MAKKKRYTYTPRRWFGKRRRRRGGTTIPIAPIVGMIPMFTPAIQTAIEGQPINQIVDKLAYNTLGIGGLNQTPPQPYFDGNKFVTNMLPLVAGILVHKFVGGRPLNINGMLARAKIPFIRI
jgi:hypothetical protein